MEINIIDFETKFETNFYDLNIEWLKRFFEVEDYDYEVLSNSKKHIINKGGKIFFAQLNSEIVGTIALMPTSKKNVFELTKMAVKPNYRNNGIGKKLLDKCIEFSKINKFSSITLYSNKKLKNAIHLYYSYGFKKINLEKNCPYKRANIKMEIKI